MPAGIVLAGGGGSPPVLEPSPASEPSSPEVDALVVVPPVLGGDVEVLAGPPCVVLEPSVSTPSSGEDASPHAMTRHGKAIAIPLRNMLRSYQLGHRGSEIRAYAEVSSVHASGRCCGVPGRSRARIGASGLRSKARLVVAPAARRG